MTATPDSYAHQTFRRSSASVKPFHPVFLTTATRPWGAENSLATIIEGLAAMGTDSTVICTSSETAVYLQRRTGAAVRLVNVPKNKVRRLITMARTVLRLTSRGSALVVFSVDMYYLGWLLRFLPQRRFRLIADLHDSFERPALKKIRFLLRGFNCVVYISDFVGKFVPSTCQKRLVVRPIDQNLTTSAPSTDEAPVTVGIAGRLDPEKNVELAITAVSLTSLDTKLNIYGDSFSDDGSYRSSLVALSGKLLGKRVNFRGTVPPSVIYSEIDVLLVANANEASGRTVGEAMAAGVPVVVPSEGGAREFIEAGVSGLIYTANDTEAASEALSQLTSDAEFRAHMGEAGRTKIRAERSVASVARSYLDAIQ